MGPFTIGAMLGAALLLFTGKKSSDPSKLPDPELKDLTAITEWKPVPGGMARYYRKSFIPSIAFALQACGVVRVYDGVYKGSRVCVYKLTDKIPAGQVNAAGIAKIGYESNAAVLVTANFWIKSGGSAYLAVIPYDQRAEWTNANCQWAIEFDNQAGEDTPGTTTTVPPKRLGTVPTGQGDSTTKAGDFDSNMTEEEKNASAAFLNRNDLAPEFYDAQAIAAETDGHAGTSHGKHPKCAAMFRARAAELRKGQSVVIEQKTPPKNWGTPGGDTVPPKADDSVPPEPTFETLMVNGYKYKDCVVMRHEVQQTGQGSAFSSDFETPQAVAVSYGQPASSWTQILPINPLIKKAPTTEGVSPWPNASGFIWIPTKWFDSRLALPSKLPAGCAPDASKPPPWGEELT